MRIKLDIPLTIREVAAAIRSESQIDGVVTYICTDSRIAVAGDLFFALRGEKYDAECFVENLIMRGVFAVCRSHYATALTVDDASEALLNLAAYYKTKLTSLKHTVAITGSVGKTTTKDILADLTEKTYKVHKTQENYNNIIGVSKTILSARRDTELLIIEMGMNHLGEISLLSKAVKPSVAVITNIGTAHIGNLGSRDEIAHAKLEIRDGLNGPLIVPYGEPLLSGRGDIFFSTENTNADYCLKEQTGAGHALSYKFYNRSHVTQISVHSDAVHIAKCACAALSCAFVIGCTKIRNDINLNFIDKNSRQTIINLKDFSILSDYYNASLESFIAGFNYVAALGGYTKKSALIGDILELGDKSEEIHYKIGHAAAEMNFDTLYIFGNFAKAVMRGATDSGVSADKIHINTDRSNYELTARQIIEHIEKNEILYAKASHKVALEHIIAILIDKEKG